MDEIIELLQDYSSDIRTYRNPPAPPEILKVVLTVLGHGNDVIESLYVDTTGRTIGITVGWASVDCSQSDDYDMPFAIFAAEDPAKATKIWLLENELTDAKNKVARAQREVEHYTNDLNEINEKISRLKGE